MCSKPHEPGAATLSATHREQLLRVAQASIAHGLRHGAPLPPDPDAYPEALRAPRASFVTLHSHGALRGCIGSLEARRPLLDDVAHNAFAAAFRDPRFAPLQAAELAGLSLHIAVLQPAEALRFDSEAALLAQLRPGVDGLIIEAGAHRATFLPSVWESLPAPRDFLAQLKRKAGLAEHYWSPALKAWRYSTESFPE